MKTKCIQLKYEFLHTQPTANTTHMQPYQIVLQSACGAGIYPLFIPSSAPSISKLLPTRGYLQLEYLLVNVSG
jgi:hypothetical protein